MTLYCTVQCLALPKTTGRIVIAQATVLYVRVHVPWLAPVKRTVLATVRNTRCWVHKLDHPRGLFPSTTR
jgi:hypothetical protein